MKRKKARRSKPKSNLLVLGLGALALYSLSKSTQGGALKGLGCGGDCNCPCNKNKGMGAWWNPFSWGGEESAPIDTSIPLPQKVPVSSRRGVFTVKEYDKDTGLWKGTFMDDGRSVWINSIGKIIAEIDQ